MRVKVVFFSVVLILCSGITTFLRAEQPVMKTLAAHVVEVAENSESISVDFRHPVTKEDQKLIFYMDDQSGLSKLKSLKDLRTGQVVSIDYIEGKKGRFFIRRIAKVKLSGPPPGLEDFDGI